MEGKGLLFKVFADVDVFDIEVNEKDPEKLIQVVKAIAPTSGDQSGRYQSARMF
jgi:malate dehydrogenase (oxaloacetate-decarboxylating)(NADP+)